MNIKADVSENQNINYKLKGDLIMKKVTLLFTVIVLSVLVWSCGENTTEKGETKNVQKKETEEKKISKRDMTVELYSKVINEQRKLLMEKYWEQFKGKEYNEVKDKYEEYNKKEDAIIAKYNLEDILVLGSFFRSNFSEIQEYRKSDPNAKEYPEYDEARKKMIDFSFTAMAEKNQ